MTQIVVIGAGIIGLGIAYELRRRNVDVTLVDPRDPGTGASDGNTGWVVPVLSGPVPAPGLPGQVSRWMLRSDAPFHVDLRTITSHLKWLGDFWRNCEQTRHQYGLRVLGRLNAASYTGFERWREEGLTFEWERPGVLFAAESPGPIAHLVYDVNSLIADGYRSVKWLESDSLKEVEPSLSRRMAYGVEAGREQYVRPEDVILALVEAIGRDRIIKSSVTRIDSNQGSHVIETSGARTIQAGALVISAGAWTKEIGKMIGLDLPVIAGKGYSITVDDPELTLQRPTYLAEAKIACTPFRGANRFAGMMELTSPNDRIDPARLLTMTTALNRYLPGWDRGSRRTAWSGSRPMTPDGLPVVGKTSRRDGVYVASGHGMLGVTMAPVTGEIIADLITRGTIDYDIKPFSPDRF